MRLNRLRIEDLCRDHGMNVGQLLRKAGVSRTAYYALARRQELLPGTIRKLARTLGVGAAELLDDDEQAAAEMRRLAEEADELARRHRGANAENMRHALILLRYDPEERLRRALTRAS